jgi:hypothetical protein
MSNEERKVGSRLELDARRRCLLLVYHAGDRLGGEIPARSVVVFVYSLQLKQARYLRCGTQ